MPFMDFLPDLATAVLLALVVLRLIDGHGKTIGAIVAIYEKRDKRHHRLIEGVLTQLLEAEKTKKTKKTKK